MEHRRVIGAGTLSLNAANPHSGSTMVQAGAPAHGASGALMAVIPDYNSMAATPGAWAGQTHQNRRGSAQPWASAPVSTA